MEKDSQQKISDIIRKYGINPDEIDLLESARSIEDLSNLIKNFERRKSKKYKIKITKVHERKNNKK